MQSQKFSIRKLASSFHYAFRGIGEFIFSERNAKIHLLATVIVIVAAIFFRVTPTESILLSLAVGLVWITEMINTCIERVMNFISTEDHPEIRYIKDVSAAAVLISSLTALIVGSIIILPKIL